MQIQDSTVSVGAKKTVAFPFLLLLFLFKQLQLLMESRRADVTGNSYRAASGDVTLMAEVRDLFNDVQKI